MGSEPTVEDATSTSEARSTPPSRHRPARLAETHDGRERAGSRGVNTMSSLGGYATSRPGSGASGCSAHPSMAPEYEPGLRAVRTAGGGPSNGTMARRPYDDLLRLLRRVQ